MILSTTVAYLYSSLNPPTIQIFTLIVLTIAFGEVLLVERILARTILSPLEKLRTASRQIAKGNYRFALSSRKLKANSRNDDLVDILNAFAILRNRIAELEQSFEKMKEEKATVQQTSNYHIAEKERELERRNAILIGQADDLEKTIAELSSRNQELSQAYEKLEKLDKGKTDFLLIAAHELRTPIQPILGFAKLAEKGQVNRDLAWKTIESEAKKLADMATDILDAGRIESGSASYKMKPVSIKEILEVVTAGSPNLFNGSGAVAIVKDFDSDAKIMADGSRLKQALSNIVGNAVKFGGDSPITIKTRNIVEKGIVEINVIDSGNGIDPEVLPILFNKFVTKTEANQRGTGLGLYIARSIIESHGGRVSAQNNPSQGATFTITLPLTKESQNTGRSKTGLEIAI